MCCCGKPVINGEPGYRWQPDDMPRIRSVDPPTLADGEALLYDEPGRCGGLDSHSHHYRVVKRFVGTIYVLVRHGGGDERIRLCSTGVLMDALSAMNSTGRYWMLNAIYHAHSDGERKGREETAMTWRKAAAEKRIKTRKLRGTDAMKVWIEPAVQEKQLGR